MSNLPFALIILDGWGHREDTSHNAIASARKPFYDSLIARYPHTLLEASEEYVGLPHEQIGNSEVGHMTIGAGKIIDVDLVRVTKAIESGDFYGNPAFAQLFGHVKKHGSVLHIYGLVSPGGIHSHRDHLYEFLKAAKSSGVTEIAIHAFTDGRDVPPRSAAEYLKELEDVIDEIGIGKIATVSGRFYAMDRDKNWDRIERAEKALFGSEGTQHSCAKPSEVLRELYKQGVLDEMLEPLVFLDDSGFGYPLRENDGVFFFNFRADRARQLSEKILDKKKAHNICFVTLTEYDKTYDSIVAFPPSRIETTLAAELARSGLTQAHIAETEKYAHVTYFFNGGSQTLQKGEEHILVESRKDVQTHDQAPEMRAAEVAQKAVESIEKGTDFVLVNLANADMVGHTAKVPAIISAVEAIDAALSQIVSAIQRKGGTVMITADHGNAEQNIDPHSNEMHTAHTLNPVPCIVTKDGLRLTHGTLADITPTILELLNIEKPASMTGVSLIEK